MSYIYIYIFMYVYTIINHKNICTVYACKWPRAVGPPCVGCNVARRQRTSCPTWAKQKSLWWLVPWNLEAHLRMMPQSRPNSCMFDMLWSCAWIQMKTNKTCGKRNHFRKLRTEVQSVPHLHVISPEIPGLVFLSQVPFQTNWKTDRRRC